MQQQNSSDQISDQLVEFYAYLKGVRATTDSTVEAYKHDIDTYLEFLESKPEIAPNGFTISDRTLRGFVTFLRGKGNVESTIQRRLDGVNALWKFLHLEYDFSTPKTARDCGIRLKNKRNPSSSIPRTEYNIFMEAIYDGLRKIK